MAHWARINPLKFFLYSRSRFVTFIVESLMMFFGVIAYVFYQTFKNKEWSRRHYVYSLCSLGIVIIIALIDYHFTKVIQYRARKVKRQQEREAEQRALDEEEWQRKAAEEYEKEKEAENAENGEQNENGEGKVADGEVGAEGAEGVEGQAEGDD